MLVERSTVTQRLVPAAWLMGAGIVLVSLILRPGATSVGPVLAEIRQGTAMGPTGAALLSALPGLSFAVSGAVAARAGHRLGSGGALALACLMAALGLGVRALSADAAVFVAASIVGLFGAGMGNVLLPMAIKQRFPLHSGAWTAVYVTVLPIGAVLPQLVAPMIIRASGTWRHTLAVWAAVSGLAALPWLAMGLVRLLRVRRRPAAGSGHGATSAREELGAAGDLHARASAPERPSGPRARHGGSAGAQAPPLSMRQLARSPRARALALFFGMQSMQAYVAFGWLAQIYRDAGASMSRASLLLACYSVWGIPGGLIVPPLVARSRHLQGWVVFFSALLIVGYGGLMVSPAHGAWLWPCALGVSGFCFQVVLVLLTARTRDYRVTAAISGFTQGAGYLVASAGPFVVGWLHASTGGWTVPLLALAASSVLMGWSGWRASAPGTIDDELA